ncbi:unnamed protein product, partial [Lymnaea stagnalis]
EIQSLTSGFPHVYFTRVSGWITAFVTLERCLSVATPLKVKTLVTRNLVIACNVSAYLTMTLCLLPVYYTSFYAWKFDSKFNKTLIGIVYTSNRQNVLSVSLLITELALPLVSFGCVIACSSVLCVHLNNKMTWRQSVTTLSIKRKKQASPNKERKIVAMVTIVAVIFIVCFTPVSVLLAARAIVPELDIRGRYSNMNALCAYLSFLLRTTNSSCNIFVYYKMSSRYR